MQPDTFTFLFSLRQFYNLQSVREKKEHFLDLNFSFYIMSLKVKQFDLFRSKFILNKKVKYFRIFLNYQTIATIDPFHEACQEKVLSSLEEGEHSVIFLLDRKSVV